MDICLINKINKGRNDHSGSRALGNTTSGIIPVTGKIQSFFLAAEIGIPDETVAMNFSDFTTGSKFLSKQINQYPLATRTIE